MQLTVMSLMPTELRNHGPRTALATIGLALLAAIAVALACTVSTPTPTAAPTLSPAPTATPEPTATATAVPSSTPVPTATATTTPTATATATPSPTRTPSPTPTATPTATSTATPTLTPSPTPTLTPTPVPTHTPTPVPTSTPVPTQTATPSPSPTPTPTPVPNPPEQRAALEAFYVTTGGDNWTNNENWLTDSPLDQWYGITTDQEGNVTEISLIRNNISGTIPPEVGDLKTLKGLNLSYNDLSGDIPNELGNLEELTSLNLFSNKLTGTIPPELGNLRSLSFFSLAVNDLGGVIPKELGRLTELEHIFIQGNPFKGCIPDPLHHIAVNDFDLVTLPYCGFNPSVPDDRAVLVKLYNSTDGDNWRNNDNWLSDRPLATWYGIKVDAKGKVTHLDLRGNDLHGRLIPELGQLDRLIWLDLSFNRLSGPIPTEFRFLDRLRRLSIQNSDLSGEIPVEVAELDSLWILYLDNNEISGRIPEAIGQMTNLEQLGLSGNKLSGEIPRELVGLANLRYLRLASNKLMGAFPSWLKNLNSLVRLTLGDNQLTGDLSLLSEDLEELAHLETFSIAGNDFSGCIPESIRNLKVTDLVFSEHNYCEAASEQIPITPEFIKWEVGDAVRPVEERAARLGVQWLFEYAESIGWPVVGDDITVYFMTLEPLVYASAIEDGTIRKGEIESQRDLLSSFRGIAREDSNFNRATEEGDGVYSPYHIASLLIHENIHTAFQYDINGLHTSPSLNRHLDESGPAWYTEGMARYFDRLITSLHGGDTEFLCRDCVRMIDGEYVPVGAIQLSDAEERDTCEYVCGAFAIELLASIVGQRHIVDFYTMQRPGQTWQRAFKEAFDISVPDFYALYDQHRAAGFPALNPPIVPETGR